MYKINCYQITDGAGINQIMDYTTTDPEQVKQIEVWFEDNHGFPGDGWHLVITDVNACEYLYKI